MRALANTAEPVRHTIRGGSMYSDYIQSRTNAAERIQRHLLQKTTEVTRAN